MNGKLLQGGIKKGFTTKRRINKPKAWAPDQKRTNTSSKKPCFLADSSNDSFYRPVFVLFYYILISENSEFCNNPLYVFFSGSTFFAGNNTPSKTHKFKDQVLPLFSGEKN